MKKTSFAFIALLCTLFLGIIWTIIPNQKSKYDPYQKLFQDNRTPKFIGQLDSVSQIPILALKGPKNERLQIRSLKMTSYLEDGFSRTRYDLILRNPYDKTLEAEFQFPLQEGQTLSHFALEVNGELRPAVAVEKQKARIAYEATVRRGVDPGLVEKVAGNIFKMRVFPLLPSASKHIQFEVLTVLKQDANHAYFNLPMKTQDPIGRFEFNAITYHSGKAQILKHLTSLNSCLDTQVKLRTNLPLITQPKVNIIGKYAYLNTNLSLPHKYARKKAPKCLTVCWDVSGSRSQRTIQKEKELLKDYLKWINKGKLELLFFAHQVIEKIELPIQNGRVVALDALLDKHSYDGGSALSCLSFGPMRGDEILLFSDGLNTIGSDQLKLGKAAIYPIVNSEQLERGYLQNLAQSTGGTLLNLRQQSIDLALKLLQRKYLRFLGFKEQSDSISYYQSAIDPASQRIMLSIQMPKNQNKLTAQFGLDQQHILSEKKLVFNGNKSIAKGNTQYKRWAIAKLNKLEEQPERFQKEICALGVKHKLVSSASSLLVLDSLADYLEFRIVPPKSMQQAYFKAIQKMDKKDASLKEDHMKFVKKEWKSFQKWYWNNPRKQKRAKVENVARRTEVVHGDLQQGVPPPPVTANEVQESEDTAEQVVDEQIRLSLNPILGGTTYNWSSSSAFIDHSFESIGSAQIGSYTSTVTSNGNSVSMPTAPSATIAVAPWNPKTPYMRSLRKYPKEKAYAHYLTLRSKYAQQPSFYIDVCDFFLARNMRPEALRILTNLAELRLKDPELLRVLARKLLQLKAKRLALSIFKTIIQIRPEEPQSYRDYGMALAEVGNYNEAVHQLYKVVKHPYDSRFAGIHLIVLNEINHLIAQHPKQIKTNEIPSALLVQLPMDMRIVLNWDADNTDVDLWVTEPNQEKCMYSYKNTTNGGRISNDFTQGYGPEEYLIRKAPKGTYLIQAHYYGNHRPSLSGKAILTVQLYQYFGTPYEIKREFTRRLSQVDEEINLATFEF